VQLHQPDVVDQLAALDARLLVVSFADLDRLSHWGPYFRRRFLAPAYAERNVEQPPADPFARTRFLADPERGVYQAYGLGPNSVFRVYGLRILWQYLRWGLQGKPIRLRDDTLQRGGDFVVGRDGHFTLAHTGRDQSDRPPVRAILAALRQG
jgi:hypothetical protein